MSNQVCCSCDVIRKVLSFHSSEGVRGGRLLELVGLPAVVVLLFYLLVLLLYWRQLLFAVLLVLFPGATGVDLAAQGGPPVDAREVELLVDWVSV